MKRTLLTATTIFVSATAAFADGHGDHMDKGAEKTSNSYLNDALTKGDVMVDLRYRYENVDQANFTSEANASTLRARLGYETGSFHGFKILGEIESVNVIGNDELYNDTVNGYTTRPTVADPDGTELNRIQLSYNKKYEEGDQLDALGFIIGRQNINLDNQRFIGTVGWRQNSQTFDAATFSVDAFDGLNLSYGYIDQVHRIFGDDHPLGNLESESHLINASYKIKDLGKLTAYGYFLDIPDSVGLSSKTLGMRFAGKHKVGENTTGYLNLEYASQSDYGDNTASYDENYYHIKGALKNNAIKGFVGYEVLGGDGTSAFSTPLATGHKFNGWADQFLTTPANGVEDLYAGIAVDLSSFHDVFSKTKAKVIYHDFSADNGGADYGTEWNAVISKKFGKYYSASIKYASYEADTFGNDVDKLWITLGFKF